MFPMRPEPGRTVAAWRSSDAVPVLLAAVALILSIHFLRFAQAVVIPITIAVLLNLLLAPLVARLRRAGVPPALGAGLVVAVLAFLLAYGATTLSAPAAEWLQRLPQSLREIELKLRLLLPFLQAAQQAAEEVQSLGESAAPRVEVAGGDDLMRLAVLESGRVLAQAVVVVMLLFFLLAAGGRFLRRLVRVLPSFGRKRRAVEVARAVQRDIVVYLGSVTLVNAGLGVAVAVAMAVVGMPTPALWGVMAGVLNFIPYLGAATTTVVIALVALLQFDTAAQAVLPPLLFLGLTSLEAYLVTPAFVARRLTLDPVAVFLSLVAWTWLWGAAGALLAVPLLVAFKALADHLDRLAPLAVLLGERSSGPFKGA